MRILVCLILFVSVASAAALEDAGLRKELEKTLAAEDLELIDKTIKEAIGFGAQIYNIGNQQADANVKLFFQSACFKLYEGAAYKLLAKLGDRAPKATEALKVALAATEEEENGDKNAWTMRRCFDSLLGDQTKGGAGGGDVFDFP